MALIGRVETGEQPAQSALEAVPDMVLRLEDARADADDAPGVIFWASGDDFGAYEAALDDSPNVADYERITTLSDRRLYRLTFADAARDRLLHAVVVENDITTIELTMTAERMRMLARFPSRDALAAFRDACRERDMPFKLRQLYDEESVANDGGLEQRYGVTESQREALLCALDAGYFEVPRRAKMEAMADELGVSTTALSRRLRRGQRNLVQNTLSADGDT